MSYYTIYKDPFLQWQFLFREGLSFFIIICAIYASEGERVSRSARTHKEKNSRTESRPNPHTWYAAVGNGESNHIK